MSRPQIERVKALIARAPLGSYIDEKGIEILAERAAVEVTLQDEEYLFRKGDPANSFYIVAEGRLALVRETLPTAQAPRIVHVLEQGDLLGELSFIDGTPRTASVRALGEASILRFDADDIRPLSTEHPKLIFDFMRAVIKRVHHTMTTLSMQQSELADYIASGGRGRM